MFLSTKLSVLLKMIFFICLKTTKITSKIQISEVCSIQFHKYAVQRGFLLIILLITQYADDRLRPQILSVGTTANAALMSSSKYFMHTQMSICSIILQNYIKKNISSAGLSKCLCNLNTHTACDQTIVKQVKRTSCTNSNFSFFQIIRIRRNTQRLETRKLVHSIQINVPNSVYHPPSKKNPPRQNKTKQIFRRNHIFHNHIRDSVASAKYLGITLQLYLE